ncbi:MAG: class I SAM-dependent methyltransferase [Actinobacteria bacterium]|nr:class I SAM-dependent methyltransferase [Actinomycetota bacterium]
MRPRAAFLHISKCAGTSVFHALHAAAGHPTRPHQQFDTCYVAGLEHPEQLAPAARDAVAWDDRPTGVGSHVFFNHWSLPTLRHHFEAADIATALREPMSRTLSYIEYARAIPASTHRGWYPDTLPMDICRASLVDVLQLPPAGRATDNLITRQVLWGDPRIPVGGFFADDVAPGVAADAVAALSQLGVVALVEDMPGLWASLSDWLGVEVSGTHRNRTPARQVPGLLRHTRDIGTAVDLLRERTRADTAVWQHFACAAGIDDPASLADTLVERRLHQMCSTAFFASFSAGRLGAHESRSTLGAALDGMLAADASVLAVDIRPDDLPTGGQRHVTYVTGDPDRSDVHADTVVHLVDRDLVDLRDTLVGRDFDDILVGSEWLRLLRPATTFEQLAVVGHDQTRLLVVCPSRTAGADAEALLRSTHWNDVSFVPLPEGMLAIARRGAVPTGQATHYGVPIRLDDNDDSRAIVLHLCAAAPTVLELGCSEGLMTSVMSARGQRVTAVEFDPIAAASAAAHAERVVQADLDRPDSLAVLEGHRFDVVLAADVLEHLRRPEDCLRRATELLAPGGRVIVSIPNLAHADVRVSLLDGQVPYADLGLLDRTHIHWFTYDGVKSLLAAVGLVPVAWHRTHRSPGTADIPLAPDLAPIAQYWFADDPEATTFQWIVECARATEATAVDDPMPPTRPRRFVHGAAPLGIKASARALAASLTRRARRTLRR